MKENLTRQADRWRFLHAEFQSLADEEKRIAGGNEAIYLNASCDYSEPTEIIPEYPWSGLPSFGSLKAPECGRWNYEPALSENILERFRSAATEGGVTLDCPEGSDAEVFWLHKLYSYLRENNSGLLLSESTQHTIWHDGDRKDYDVKTGTICRVCESSATFCAWLRREVRSNSATESAAADNAPVNKAFTHSPDYRSVTVGGNHFPLTPRQAQVIQILCENKQAGHPDVGAAYLLEQLETPNSRLRDTFKTNRPAWRTLVEPGSTRGTIRLKV